MISILIVVVLPAPFGPSRPKSSPLPTSNEIAAHRLDLERLAAKHARGRAIGPAQLDGLDHRHALEPSDRRRARVFRSAPADRARPHPRPRPARARRRLHPRQRMRRDGRRRGAAQGAPARGSLARADVNPDGLAHDTRQNAARRRPEPELPGGVAAVRPAVVGLRRRVPARGRSRRRGSFAGLVARGSARATRSGSTSTSKLVWAYGRSSRAGRRYAQLSGPRFFHHPWLDGTAANWQNHLPDGESSFTVELPAGAAERARRRPSGTSGARPQLALTSRSSRRVCGSPSQQPSLNLQRGHCHVPCTHAMGVGHRQHSSCSVIAASVGPRADARRTWFAARGSVESG